MTRYNLFHIISKRLDEPRRFLQVLAGPRQVGKTTLARQIMAVTGVVSHYATADEPTLRDRSWLEQQWEIGRLRARNQANGAILVLDEIQKVTGWSETVKRLWDEDTHVGVQLKVIVLGSAPLLIERGLTESLAGRFEVIQVPHWSFPEMQATFGWTVEQYVYFGGYPGSAPLIADPARWRSYLVDSLIETTISRDILLMTRVDKPALLKQLFELGCAYSGQIVSLTKIKGQLSDAGNTTTLTGYLDLLRQAGLLTGLQKFAANEIRKRDSPPKFQVLNNALMSAMGSHTLQEALADRTYWGRLVESAVGVHLVNTAGSGVQIHYWRDGGVEVDFVVERGKQLAAIEVKSGAVRGLQKGLREFASRHEHCRSWVVGGDGLSLGEFLRYPAGHWVE